MFILEKNRWRLSKTKLRDLRHLHVPRIKDNLVSISKITVAVVSSDCLCTVYMHIYIYIYLLRRLYLFSKFIRQICNLSTIEKTTKESR